MQPLLHKTNESNQIPCIPLRNTIEIGNGTLPLFPLYQELKQMDGIESISLSMSSVLYCWLRELPIRQTDGSIQHNL